MQAVYSAETKLFNELGRRINTQQYRTFDNEALHYYHIKSRPWNFENLAERLNNFGHFAQPVCAKAMQSACEKLKTDIEANSQLSNLFHGVHVPFVIPQLDPRKDLGEGLISDFLGSLEASFRDMYPDSYFKAVMQGGTCLQHNLRIAAHSRYEALLDAAATGSVAGWYFPQALQQFDLVSQHQQMLELPPIKGLCLSGPVEMIHAVMAMPDLLINEEGYAPILCMSAVEHQDERLALVLKSYGPHLEFWCLSQMLVPGVAQVSEQWAGGITIFTSFE
ncbi:MAG: hypothetical protein EB072_20255 [Betaproteobacteria bacterium]|nr:hypothetical protein [Betaproteobacteria bacterium]